MAHMLVIFSYRCGAKHMCHGLAGLLEDPHRQGAEAHFYEFLGVEAAVPIPVV